MELGLQIEQLSKKIKTEVARFELESFAGFFTYFIKNRPNKSEEVILNKFSSKLKDWMYLIALNAAVEERGNEYLSLEHKDLISNWAEDLKKIKALYQEQSLGDIEHAPDLLNRFIHQASFQTFFDNGALSYMEQDLDRFKRVFTRFDEHIEKLFGVNVEIIIRWIRFADELSQQKDRQLNAFQNTKEFQAFLANSYSDKTFEQRLARLPPEIRTALEDFEDCPHTAFKFRREEFHQDFPEETVIKLLAMVTMFPEHDPKYLFYAQANPIEDTPIMRLPTNEYLHVYQKQLPIAFGSFLYQHLQFDNKVADRFRKHRDKVLEVKTLDIFKKLFGGERAAFFYHNYYVVSGKEQDILILYKDTALIIEVKASKFREPYRNAEKGFERIKDDFEEAIQYGYEQCLRVEDKFFEDEQFNIIENDLVSYTVRPNRYKNIYSIIVTLERWGPVQTDLNLLLKKEPECDFPWSVYIDDLETFVLSLRKQANNPVLSFLQFLSARNKIHGRMYATDEMDVCGTFLSNRKLYFEIANNQEASMTFSPENQEIFDDLYFTGLGFEDELYIDVKKKRKPIIKSRIQGYVINNTPK